MNIALIGFSTTGKSTIVKEVQPELQDSITSIDSDTWISEPHGGHIYNLFMKLHDDNDPIGRIKAMKEVEFRENLFLQEHSKSKYQPFISALGPNIHSRESWTSFVEKTNPYFIFLKADPVCVYKGLIRREDNTGANQNQPSFGNWNLHVTRDWNSKRQRYERIPREEAISKITKLIEVNERTYERLANAQFEANTVNKYSCFFASNKFESLKKLIKKNAG